MSRETKIMIGIGLAFVAVIAVIGFGIKSQMNPTPADNTLLIKASSHSTANPSAKVNLVEFGDYQCPACGAAYPVVKKITDDYKTNPNFNFVFRNFPLSQHQNAQIAAQAAEASGAQGKYWEMHDALYENQDKWSENGKPLDLFVGYAQKIGLDINKFKADVQSSKYSSVISSDYQDGVALGVNSTPTFYLNGKAIVGVPTYADLKAQIEADLSK